MDSENIFLKIFRVFEKDYCDFLEIFQICDTSNFKNSFLGFSFSDLIRKFQNLRFVLRFQDFKVVLNDFKIQSIYPLETGFPIFRP